MRRESLRLAIGAALVPLLVLAGCGKTPEEKEPDAEPTASLPTGNVAVPAGVTLTPPGEKLKFGEKAVVAYEPNPKRNTVLELTVRSVTKAPLSDLAMYTLEEPARKSSLYYVRVHVKNVGRGDVGKAPIPLWAVDKTNTLIQSSGFLSAPFKKCPSTALAASFAPNDKTNACLMYLVPNKGTLTGISFRPLQAFAPIEWTGPITKAKAKKKSPKTKKKN